MTAPQDNVPPCFFDDTCGCCCEAIVAALCRDALIVWSEIQSPSEVRSGLVDEKLLTVRGAGPSTALPIPTRRL